MAGGFGWGVLVPDSNPLSAWLGFETQHCFEASADLRDKLGLTKLVNRVSEAVPSTMAYSNLWDTQMADKK